MAEGRPVHATILAIGDELTLGANVDTNTAWLAERLIARSVYTVEHRTVPDDRGIIADAILELSRRGEVLLMTGGLGPTDDDLTRHALGDVLVPGEDLVTDPEAAATLERWFAGRRRTMPAANLAQAMRPRTMRLIPNPNGTAPGLAGRFEGCAIYAMPGPPREMKPMFLEHVIDDIRFGPEAVCIRTETVHAYGIGESHAAERLGERTRRGGRTEIGTTASSGVITARIRATGSEAEAGRLVAEAASAVERAWAPYCFGRGEMTLARAAGDLMNVPGATVVTAESCTGGWLGKSIVDVPGASAYFLGGWITYSNAMKTTCLGVPPEMLRRHGAVSPEVAEAMAAGALARSEASYAMAVTGVAGPDGGDEEGAKRAGLVFIALARRDAGSVTQVRRFRFRGDRTVVRDRSVKSALQMLRFALLGTDDAPLIWGVEVVTTVPRVNAYLGVGANLGDRRRAIWSAVRALDADAGVVLTAMSSIIETEALLAPGQSAQRRYLNAAVRVDTTLSARDLLDRCLAVESAHGRQRSDGRWAPRTMDLDLLLYGDCMIKEPGLEVPHPRMHERWFVLAPLAEIASTVIHPGLGRSVESLRDDLRRSPS